MKIRFGFALNIFMSLLGLLSAVSYSAVLLDRAASTGRDWPSTLVLWLMLAIIAYNITAAVSKAKEDWTP